MIRRVHRGRSLALALVASALALPAAASAQTPGSIPVILTEVSVSGAVTRDVDVELNKSLNALDCASASEVVLTFRTQDTPAGTTFVDIWRGDAGVDCLPTTARQAGDGRVCEHLAADPMLDATDGNFTITLADLLLNSSACSDGQPDISLNLWVFATGSTESTGEVTTAQYGFTSFGVDPSPPIVPVPKEDALAGDTGVSVGWEDASEALVTTVLYIDTNTGVDCAGGSSLVFAGAEAPVTGDTIVVQETSQGATSKTINPQDIGLMTGESAVVGLSAVDLNDNASVISTTICVTRIETAGFCDLYSADSGESCPDGCSVSAPGAESGAPYPLAAVATLGFVALLRRRRNR